MSVYQTDYERATLPSCRVVGQEEGEEEVRKGQVSSITERDFQKQ